MPICPRVLVYQELVNDNADWLMTKNATIDSSKYSERQSRHLNQ